MDLEFKLDTKDFEEAFSEYLNYTSRTVPEAINRAAKDIIITAADYTVKAEKSKISEDMRKKVFITIKSGKSGKMKHKFVPLAFAIVLTRIGRAGEKLSMEAIRDKVRKMISARRRSTGYIAYAGWNNALKAVGGTGFGGAKGEVNPKSKAAEGGAEPATEGVNFCKFINTATGAQEIGFSALQNAIAYKTMDIMMYIAGKMQAKADQLKG